MLTRRANEIAKLSDRQALVLVEVRFDSAAHCRHLRSAKAVLADAYERAGRQERIEGLCYAGHATRTDRRLQNLEGNRRRRIVAFGRSNGSKKAPLSGESVIACPGKAKYPNRCASRPATMRARSANICGSGTSRRRDKASEVVPSAQGSA